MDKKTDNNIHEGHRQRIINKFLENGVNAFEDHELLEILMYFVHRRRDTNELGHVLLNEFRSMDGVFSAKYDELLKVNGIGPKGALLISFIGQIRNRIGQKPLKGTSLPSIEATGKYCCSLLKDLAAERLILICLNASRNVIAVDTISNGDFGATAVDIRRIVELALKHNAVGVILAHNHPGDTVHPSMSDVAATGQIIAVLEGMNISVIDHIICSGDDYSSMAMRGVIDSSEGYCKC